MTRTLEPPEGWEQFADTKRLEATIWLALPLSDRGGSWRYYNFTSTSSIWDSDLPEQNWLVLSVRQADDGRRTVEELVIETTTSEGRCVAQLEALVQKLAEEFNVRPIEGQT